MKNLLSFFALCCIVFFPACQGDSSSQKAEDHPNRPVEDANIVKEADHSKMLLQEVPVSRIEFSGEESSTIVTYLANGKDLKKEMVEEDGLSSYEAHIATMIAISSTQCLSSERQKRLSFVLLNNENILQGRFDLPCSFIRKVYLSIGVGSSQKYETSKGSSQIIFTGHQLAISEKNLAIFKNIVDAIQPQDYKGIKVGEKMK